MTLGACGVLLIAAARAGMDTPCERASHPFLGQNPFRLKPPPTSAGPAVPTNAPVKLDLKLVGITSDSAGKRAWILIPPSPARLGVAAVTNATYFAIAEGGRQGDVEVLEIDLKGNTVKILNAGVAVTLDFATHGLAAPAALPGRVGPVPVAPPPAQSVFRSGV